MDNQVLISLIGTAGTVACATIGAYVSIRQKKIIAQQQPQRPRYFYEFSILAAAFIISAVIIARGFSSSGSDEMPTHSESLHFDSVLLKQGMIKGKKYILPSVTMIVRLDSALFEGTKRLVAENKVVYVIKAIQDIEPGSSDFTEEFHSSSSEQIDYLPGSEQEVLTDGSKGNKSWEVRFRLEKGQSRTVITGSRDIYPLALSKGRNVHFVSGLQENEDAFCYPNRDDVIGELNLIVETNTVNIRLPDGALNASLKTGDTVLPVEAFQKVEQKGLKSYRSVFATFKNIPSGSVAAVRVQW